MKVKHIIIFIIAWFCACKENNGVHTYNQDSIVKENVPQQNNVVNHQKPDSSIKDPVNSINLSSDTIIENVDFDFNNDNLSDKILVSVKKAVDNSLDDYEHDSKPLLQIYRRNIDNSYTLILINDNVYPGVFYSEQGNVLPCDSFIARDKDIRIHTFKNYNNGASASYIFNFIYNLEEMGWIMTDISYSYTRNDHADDITDSTGNKRIIISQVELRKKPIALKNFNVYNFSAEEYRN